MPTAAVSAPGEIWEGTLGGEIRPCVCSAERVELKGITFWVCLPQLGTQPRARASHRCSMKLKCPKERSAPMWVRVCTQRALEHVSQWFTLALLWRAVEEAALPEGRQVEGAK